MNDRTKDLPSTFEVNELFKLHFKTKCLVQRITRDLLQQVRHNLQVEQGKAPIKEITLHKPVNTS